MSRRHMRRVVVALAITLTTMLVTSSSSGASQDDYGTLRVRVVYPDGSLASDATICLVGFTRDVFVFGNSAVDVGPDSSYWVGAGEYFVHNSCQGDAKSEIASISNAGDAASWSPRTIYSYSLTPSKAIPGRVGAIVRPGETTIATLTTGLSTIRGTLSGDISDDRRCRVEAVGRPIGEFTESQRHGWLTFDGANYELLVPPGNYRVSAICGVASAPRYWPNNTPFLDEARIISIRHRQIISGIDFEPPRSMSLRASELKYRVSDQSVSIKHCADYQRADLRGATVQRGFQAQIGHAEFVRKLAHGSYKLRIWDCAGEGFDDIWYPNSATYEGGETFEINGELRRPDLPIPIAIVPDPPPLCDGRPATIIGTDGDDDIVGTDGVDVIVGLGGNDLIRGMGGNDIICGGPGRDRIFGGHGRDLLFGGNQNDILRGEGGKDVLHGGRGNDLIIGGGRDDTLFGGPGRDRLFGGQGRDRLLGGNKNDFLRGDGGRDFLDGGRGNDILIGGGGNDGLFGGPGPIDRLFGKAGFDLCVDAQPNTIIRECEIGVDPFGD